MGIFFLTSDLMEAARGQKTPLRGQKWHEGVNLLNKVFNESCSATSKPRVQSDLNYNLRVKRYSNLRGHCIRLYVAAAQKHAHSANESREAGDPSVYNLYNNIIDEKLSSITHIMASRKATHNKRGVMSLLPDHQHHCRRVRDKYSRLDLANESFLFRQSF